MSDDVYKFQKKPINTMGNLENASELAEMAKVRQKIMDEAKQQSNLGNMSVEENVVPISGNIPEKYKQSHISCNPENIRNAWKCIYSEVDLV